MSLDLVNTVFNCLQQQPEKKLKAREIAEWIFKTYPDKCRQKQKRSTATINPLNTKEALIGQIVAEIGSVRPNMQKKYPQIKITEGRPRQYYFTELEDSAEITRAEANQEEFTATTITEDAINEQGLYPVLSKFLSLEFSLYSKRIDEKKSINSKGKGGNKWLYPDLVAMENLSEDWHKTIKDCVKEYADKKTRLWSFEVKILINRSNVREVFFQTVSNSSWANFGYLVANEIQGSDTLKELRILASLHGIGFIKLDANNPSESQIIIPAKERIDIDWDTANRLSQENKDFQDYIENICQFYQTGKIKKYDWDINDKDKLFS
jgi:hypothetical protein